MTWRILSVLTLNVSSYAFVIAGAYYRFPPAIHVGVIVFFASLIAGGRLACPRCGLSVWYGASGSFFGFQLRGPRYIPLRCGECGLPFWRGPSG